MAESEWSKFCHEFSEWLRIAPEEEIKKGLKYLAKGAQESAALLQAAYNVCSETGTGRSKAFELLDTSESMAKVFGVPEDQVYGFRLKFIQGHKFWWSKKGEPYFEKN